MYFGRRSESLLNAATCDIPTSSPAAVWQLADFKITAQRLFDQGRASATLCLRLISTHLLPFYPYSLSNVHIPWCHFLLSFRIRDIWLHMPPSKRFRCCSGVSSYNPSSFFCCLFPQTSMSVRPLLAWMAGHVWMKWTSSLVSAPKAGLEPPVRAPCQHVGCVHLVPRPHTHIFTSQLNSCSRLDNM